MNMKSPGPMDRGCRRATWLAAVFAFASMSAAAQPRDAAAFQVQIWASGCMACHGPDGRAEGAGLLLAGKPADELRGKLLAYKTGRLQGTIMHQHAKGYSDDELGRIAAYFAAIK